MKMFHSFLVLSLLVIALSGCSSCPCKKSCPMKAVAPVEVAEPVAAPAVQEAAPAAVPEPVEEKIPTAVLK